MALLSKKIQEAKTDKYVKRMQTICDIMARNAVEEYLIESGMLPGVSHEEQEEMISQESKSLLELSRKDITEFTRRQEAYFKKISGVNIKDLAISTPEFEEILKSEGLITQKGKVSSQAGAKLGTQLRHANVNASLKQLGIDPKAKIAAKGFMGGFTDVIVNPNKATTKEEDKAEVINRSAYMRDQNKDYRALMEGERKRLMNMSVRSAEQEKALVELTNLRKQWQEKVLLATRPETFMTAGGRAFYDIGKNIMGGAKSALTNLFKKSEEAVTSIESAAEAVDLEGAAENKPKEGQGKVYNPVTGKETIRPIEFVTSYRAIDSMNDSSMAGREKPAQPIKETIVEAANEPIVIDVVAEPKEDDKRETQVEAANEPIVIETRGQPAKETKIEPQREKSSGPSWIMRGVKEQKESVQIERVPFAGDMEDETANTAVEKAVIEENADRDTAIEIEQEQLVTLKQIDESIKKIGKTDSAGIGSLLTGLLSGLGAVTTVLGGVVGAVSGLVKAMGGRAIPAAANAATKLATLAASPAGVATAAVVSTVGMAGLMVAGQQEYEEHSQRKSEESGRAVGSESPQRSMWEVITGDDEDYQKKKREADKKYLKSGDFLRNDRGMPIDESGKELTQAQIEAQRARWKAEEDAARKTKLETDKKNVGDKVTAKTDAAKEAEVKRVAAQGAQAMMPIVNNAPQTVVAPQQSSRGNDSPRNPDNNYTDWIKQHATKMA